MKVKGNGMQRKKKVAKWEQEETNRCSSELHYYIVAPLNPSSHTLHLLNNPPPSVITLRSQRSAGFTLILTCSSYIKKTINKQENCGPPSGGRVRIQSILSSLPAAAANMLCLLPGSPPHTCFPRRNSQERKGEIEGCNICCSYQTTSQ